MISTTPTDRVFTRSFPVGQRYRCTLCIPLGMGPVAHMTAEWEPTLPTKLSASEQRDYRRGRDAAVAELAAQIGVGAAVLETGA